MKKETDAIIVNRKENLITKRKNGTTRVQSFSESPSKTDQSFKKDCDVNTIMARFMKTGQISHLAKGTAAYHDVSDVPDLDEALTIVAKAQSTFDALPANIRRRFGNSPTEMTTFLMDPKNAQEAFELGLLSENTLKNLAPPSTLAGETRGSGKKSTSTTTTTSQKNNSTNSKATNDDNLNDDE
ncbi:MAG: internal scaffolding protein [Malazfec virus 6]